MKRVWKCRRKGLGSVVVRRMPRCHRWSASATAASLPEGRKSGLRSISYFFSQFLVYIVTSYIIGGAEGNSLGLSSISNFRTGRMPSVNRMIENLSDWDIDTSDSEGGGYGGRDSPKASPRDDKVANGGARHIYFANAPGNCNDRVVVGHHDSARVLRNILLKSEEKLTRKDHSELVGEGAYVKSKKTIGKIRGPVRNVKMGTKQPTGFTFTSLKSSSTVKLETFQQSASTYELVQESYSCMLRLKSSIEEDALGMQPGPGEARVADISDESGKKRVHICSRNYRLRLCFGDCDERPTVSAQKLVATWFVEMVGGFICIFSGVLDAYTKLRYLSYVMDISTATVDYLDLVHDILLPVVIKDKSRFSGRRLAAPALDPALKLYKWLHDILSPRLRNILLKSEEKLTRKDHSELVGEGAYVKSKKPSGRLEVQVADISDESVLDLDLMFGFWCFETDLFMCLKGLNFSACFNAGEEAWSVYYIRGKEHEKAEKNTAIHQLLKPLQIKIVTRLCFGDCDERPTVSAQKLVATWFVEMVGGFICIFSGVLDAYTKLRYLSYVMDISTATVDYLDLVHDILLPVVIKDKSRFSGRRLAAPALDPALKLYKWLHDILSPSGLGNWYAVLSYDASVRLCPTRGQGAVWSSSLLENECSLLRDVLGIIFLYVEIESSIEEDALGMQPGPGEARVLYVLFPILRLVLKFGRSSISEYLLLLICSLPGGFGDDLNLNYIVGMFLVQVADISDESVLDLDLMGKKRGQCIISGEKEHEKAEKIQLYINYSTTADKDSYKQNYRLRLCFGDCDERPTVSAQKLVATWLSIVSILYLGNQSKKKLGKIQLYIKYSTTADESSCKATVSAKKLVVATWFVDEFGVLDAYTKLRSVFWGKFLFKLSRYTLWSFRITRHLMNIKDVLKLYKWLHDILSPEVLSEGLSWMVSAVDDFGTSHIKLKVLKTYRFRKVDKVTDSTSTAGSDLKVRLESIESVTKILEEANKPILPAGTGDLFGALKGLEKSGKGILSDALKCLECTMRVPMLGAAHLDKMLPYIILSDAEIGIEGRRDLFKWLSRRQLTGLVSFLDEIKLLKPTASAMMVFSLCKVLFSAMWRLDLSYISSLICTQKLRYIQTFALAVISKQLKPYGALQDNYESGRSVSSRLSGTPGCFFILQMPNQGLEDIILLRAWWMECFYFIYCWHYVLFILLDLNRGHSLVKIMQVIAIATTEGFKNEAKNMLVASGNIETCICSNSTSYTMDRQRREEELKGRSSKKGFSVIYIESTKHVLELILLYLGMEVVFYLMNVHGHKIACYTHGMKNG
ncbi:hypothetical protein SASPL_111985 [Salvia splendens]|uniref:Uncharacterized protein n=1 Tax=Salvia splendens TaxID=180675 RepID=A0A8X9A457_SALSN|nr:hypothetical protein SASPL_111985 [Salvia splendens]